MRLHEIKCNENDWCIKKNHEDGYYIVNKHNYDAYFINGDILGIEQVDDDSFLIQKKLREANRQLIRVKLNDGKMDILFNEDFGKMYFLSDDRILLDNKMVYSIKENAEVEAFNKIKYEEISVKKYTKKNIRYSLDDKDFIYVDIVKCFLIVRHKISTVRPQECILYAVDVDNFDAVTDAFSTLRDAIVPLSDDYTINDLIKEDKKYKQIIDDMVYDMTSKIEENGRLKILELCKKNS